MPTVIRRPAAVLAAAALLFAPGVAHAAFTTAATGKMSTATVDMVQPVGTAAASRCSNSRDLTITFTNYGYVPRASAFRIEIFQDTSGTASLLVVDKAPNDLSPITIKLSGAKSARLYNVRGIYTAVGGNTWTGQPLAGVTVSC